MQIKEIRYKATFSRDRYKETTLFKGEFVQLYEYRYFDDMKVFYISGLSVAEDHRKKGEATKILDFQENGAKLAKIEKLRLWVEIGSWMFDWYTRRGFKPMDSEFKDPRFLWVEKIL